MRIVFINKKCPIVGVKIVVLLIVAFVFLIPSLSVATNNPVVVPVAITVFFTTTLSVVYDDKVLLLLLSVTA
jgi:hypothetical protein